MAEIVNEFSWSHSRRELHARCLRAYYLSYYASWGGWKRYASHLSRTAYRLKKLDNRWTWMGGIVHEAISRVLLTTAVSRAMDARQREKEQAVEWAHDVARWELTQSKDGHRDAKNDRGFWGLTEHEYGEDVPKEEWKKVWETARGGLEWWFESGWLERARTAAVEGALLEVDSGAFDEGRYLFMSGTKVWAVPDLALLEGDVAVAADWKTGAPQPSHADQLSGYTFYLAARYGSRGVSLKRVRATLVYLGRGEEQVEVSLESLAAYGQRVAESVASMRALLEDPEQNKPKPMEAFAMTEDRRECSRCAYRRLCGREK